jgi:4-amino-4-deoxy-L-arabinose transferase-like glycosyltransferase
MNHHRGMPMSPSRLLFPAERLVAALADPARRERAVLGVLAAYVALWTLYGAFAKASQDIHFDMAELAAWSRDLAFGYSKHPPLAAWLVRAWFTLFPSADWAYYLLAMTVVAVALWIAWRLSGHYLDGEKRVVALALLTLIPFYNFHALKFNPNTVLLPFWAMTTLWFIRSFETRGRIDAALASIGAAACMMGKYWSIFLLLGLGLAALTDPRRGAYFRSAAPWITIAVGAFALAPHLVWLVANDFLPFSYAVTVHGSGSIASAVTSGAGYVVGAIGYVALPLLLALAIIRPNRAALADLLKPPTPERRLVAVTFWAPLLIPAVIAPLFGVEINSLWTMSAWTLLPVVLLSSPLVVISRRASTWIVAVAIMVPFAFLVASPFIARAIHRTGVAPIAAHGRMLAEHVAKAWNETTRLPLQIVGGDAGLAYAVAFYLADRPSVLVEPDPHRVPSIDQETLARSGLALVCPMTNQNCVKTIEARAGAAGSRSEVELARSYFSVAGPTARYLIVIVPPRQK